jgi:radical SAM protein with 4Fe4S-binding SPASM domain
MRTNRLKLAAEEFRSVRSFKDLSAVCGKACYAVAQRVWHGRVMSGHPLSLQIEPTNLCNIACICCSRDRMIRPQGRMDFDLFQRILDDAARSRVSRIHLYLHGESLLHPRIAEMIRCIKAKGLAFNLATNGMLLDATMAEAILDAGADFADHIVFSMLGDSQAVHEQIMRGVNHAQVVANLTGFIERRNRRGLSGPVIETLLYTMPENRHEEEAFLRRWQGVADHVRRVGPISREYARRPEPNAGPHRRTHTCRNLWERMTVYWNGDVTTCIADLDGKAVVGNLREQSLREVWTGARLREIRTLHRSGAFDALPLCSACDW